MITLLLGGEASGKSSHGLHMLEQAPAPHCILVTGKAKDMTFRKQIMDHKKERHPHIAVQEAAADLPEVLIQTTAKYPSVLIDSMDFWLFSCQEAGLDMQQQTAYLASALKKIDDRHIFLVSCETGLGPIAATQAIRSFVRSMGRLNQTLARLAETVILVVAGQPVVIKNNR